jgi:hypothetical protein
MPRSPSEAFDSSKTDLHDKHQQDGRKTSIWGIHHIGAIGAMTGPTDTNKHTAYGTRTRRETQPVAAKARIAWVEKRCWEAEGGAISATQSPKPPQQ